MFYCCGITEKGVMPHNEDALMIGKNVITNGAVEYHLDSPFIAAVSVKKTSCLNIMKNSVWF